MLGAEIPAEQKLPSGHITPDEDPLTQYWPAGQRRISAPLHVIPPGHGVNSSEAPIRHSTPGEQGSGIEVLNGQKKPIGHIPPSLTPASQKNPGSHGWYVADPGGQNEATGHGVGSGELAGQKKDEGQGVKVADSTPQKAAGGHSVWFCDPSTQKNPASHDIGNDVPTGQ